MDVSTTSRTTQAYPVAKPTQGLLRQFQLRFWREPATPAVCRMVSARAWRLSRRVADGECMRTSFEQDLLLAVCKAAATWDPERGTYLGWIAGALDLCERRIREGLRRRAERWSRTVWLDEPCGDDASSAVIDLVPVDRVWRMVAAIDIRACRAWLRGLDRRIFDLFLRGFSPNEIRQRCNIALTAFYGNVWPNFIHNIRRFYV